MEQSTIKLLVMDVDGTLTDGKLYFASDGTELKSFNIHDGLGIKMLLQEHGIILVIITGRKSSIVARRSKELDISELHQGVHDKISLMKTLLAKYNLSPREVAYIGDDLNDYDCIRFCGVTGCPQDAVDKVRNEVDYVCRRNGGEGAVREFIEWIIDSAGKGDVVNENCSIYSDKA